MRSAQILCTGQRRGKLDACELLLHDVGDHGCDVCACESGHGCVPSLLESVCGTDQRDACADCGLDTRGGREEKANRRGRQYIHDTRLCCSQPVLQERPRKTEEGVTPAGELPGFIMDMPSPSLLLHIERREKRWHCLVPHREGLVQDPNKLAGHINAKVRLNNLVSKTLRRPLLAGDIVYETRAFNTGFEATVRVHGLEDSTPLEFSGVASQENTAELSAAAAAVAALPPPPSIEPRYPKPQDAASWVAEQLSDKTHVELDSTMADVLPTLAYVHADMGAEASFILEEDPCRVRVRRSAVRREWLPQEVRCVLVSRKTHGSKLAAALRARLLGEDGGESYPCLELKMAGKSACKEAAIATKILQRFLPQGLEVSFSARFEQFEGYRARGLVLTIQRQDIST
ncbi:unnamed protein product [Symbiodinium natans]|uniref:Uncharacterized protein n=1 Tax=Symbiodinium natans TaxID=878477 RepID=A0A812KU35_9DINO|nr:unnamed protein product [Symbiodinium natans]